jgi:acyl-CoA thioester hydrolase
MIRHEHRLAVRYAETDQMGVVYHANYLVYMEEGRTALMAALGRPYHELERSGIALVVRKAELRFRSPARFGDRLRVTTTIEGLGGASIRFGYAIDRESDEVLLATGSTELACVDLSAPEPAPRLLPADLRAGLEG